LTKYSIKFSPHSVEQLAELYNYLSVSAGPKIANDYVNAVIDHCEKLHTFPLRGVPRNDIREGLRVTHYEGKTVIAYAVSISEVSVLGVFHQGQDYEQKLVKQSS